MIKRRNKFVKVNRYKEEILRHEGGEALARLPEQLGTPCPW